MKKTRQDIKKEMLNLVWTSIQNIIEVNANFEVIVIPEEEVVQWNYKELEIQKKFSLKNMQMVILLDEVMEEIKDNLAEIGWKLNEDGDLQKKQ